MPPIPADFSGKPTDYPDWAPPEGPTTVVDPGSAKKGMGYLDGEPPPAQEHNYLFKRLSHFASYVGRQGQKVGEFLISNAFDAILPRYTAYFAAHTVGSRTLIAQAQRDVDLFGAVVPRPRLYVHNPDGGAVALEVTLNAIWDPAGPTWGKDSDNLSAWVLRLERGKITLGSRPATVNTAWGEDYDETDWQGITSLGNAIYTDALAHAAGLAIGLRAGGAAVKTRVLKIGDVRLYASDAHRLEVTVNASWSNSTGVWSKDTDGQQAHCYQFSSTGLHIASRSAANNGEWGDDFLQGETDYWDEYGQALYGQAVADLKHGVLLGSSRYLDAVNALVPRIFLSIWAGAGASTDKTALLDTSRFSVGGVRMYVGANGQLDITVNAGWSNSTDKWSKDDAAKGAWLIRLSPTDDVGDFFLLAHKASTQDTDWTDDVNAAGAWTRLAMSSRLAPKAWCYFSSSTALTTHKAINCTVGRDTGSDKFTVAFATSFPDANYAVQVNAVRQDVGLAYNQPCWPIEMIKSASSVEFKLASDIIGTVEPIDTPSNIRVDVLVHADPVQ